MEDFYWCINQMIVYFRVDGMGYRKSSIVYRFLVNLVIYRVLVKDNFNNSNF